MRLIKRRSLFTDELLADERGAATTEGVIVAVFLILCFALSLFLFKRYALALRTTATARQALWARAVPGTDEGDLDGRLAGAYPSYEARMRQLAPVLEPYHDTPRVDWQREEREDELVSSPYMGAQEIEYRTVLSTVANETPDTPEDDLIQATVDTWCRVSPVCEPGDVGDLVGGGAP